MREDLLVYAAAAAGIIALHVATAGNLGFHTDELYYLDCGRHPALGYVDFPPIVPLLARLETGLLGVTPWTLRLIPSVIGGVLVVLTGLYVRRLGGSLQLQGIALLVGIAAPFLIGSNWVYQAVTFDQLTWMVALYWYLCLVIDRRPRYWIYLGTTLGIGLETKYTIVGLIAGIVIAVLLSAPLRKQLRTRYPWIAAAIALVIWTPNLVWQVAHGFPSLVYVANHSGAGGGIGIFVIEFLVLLFFFLPLWVVGLISLFRTASLRPLGIACAVPLVIFLFVGKSYYPIPAVPIVLAQGLIVLSRIERRRLRTGLEIGAVVASVLELVVLSPLTLPITPPSRLHATGLDVKNEVFADSVGWEGVADEVTRIYRDLPSSLRGDTVIISAYYGVPGALAIYGNAQVLPAVMSPQLSDWYWLPKHLTATHALMVDYKPEDVAWMCTSATLVAHLSVPYQVVGLEQGAPVTLCQLTAPIPKIWRQLRNFS